MDPFTSKTDYNLNYPHKINTPTKMVSRIRENQNWRIIYATNVTLHRTLRMKQQRNTFLLSRRICLQNLGVHELIRLR